MLDCGFNLLVYGAGSKFDLMNLFIQKQLANYYILVFNAFNPVCNMKKIIDGIINWLIRVKYLN